ncbi:spore germination protein [Paenibacillus woosongensis]|uniref:Spore germination protein n=1 Tax=Paenibacillus woosongensis TaxID=307580 RepID=A0AA95I7R0_9BACL|nr:spore germination protein [Paenibacillus woosongensis]WHX47270.1 spore germination protein [Paenibacillus woosongensis]
MSFWIKLLRRSRKNNSHVRLPEHVHKAIPASSSVGGDASPSRNDGREDERVPWMKQQLANCSDIVFREFKIKAGYRCTLIYIRSTVDQTTIQDVILRGLLDYSGSEDNGLIRYLFDDQAISVSEIKIVTETSEALKTVLSFGIVLMIEGESRIMTFPSASSLSTRAIEEAPNESVIRGPREAFNESLDTSLSLVRRRLKSKNLKTEELNLGSETNTRFVIAYIEGICKPELVQEIKRRLSYLEIDAVLGSSTLEETIEDSPYSPFPQIEYTERPDIVSASLLEGRVGIIVDGTPSAILAPVTLPMLLQTSEDYFQRYIAATWIRWIRYLFLFVSLLLPSLYIAITTFHPEMIPYKLLMTIAAAREIVPFPAFVEAFIMELSFEALREASIRIPKSIGQAVSIIGALIIGTAAVQAGIVSAAMVIIVSLTGIASFMIPHFDLGLSIRLLRFPIMALASMLGLFGITCGLIILYIHLLNLKSLGVPYLYPFTPLVKADLNDTLVRAPWWAMRNRPEALTRNEQRLKKNPRGWVKQKED